MTNAYCVTRSNYFHVKNPDNFKGLMSRVVCEGEFLSLWEEQDDDGNPIFGFGVYDDIIGIYPEDRDEEYGEGYEDFDAFCGELRKHLADGDACIIMRSGHEKLRCVFGDVTIITKNSVVNESLANYALRTAREELNLPTWTTRIDGTRRIQLP